MSNIASNDRTSGEANTPRNSALDTAVEHVVQQLNETSHDRVKDDIKFWAKQLFK